MKQTWKIVAAAALVATALLQPAAADTTWTMASGYPDSNFLTQNLKIFVADVNKATGGKLKIVLHDNDSLIKLDSIKRSVQTGQIQAGEIRLGVYGNEDPMYVLAGVPFIASTYDEAWRLMQAQKPYFDALMARNNLQILGYQVWPGQGFYTKQPIASAEDFKGQRLRIYSTTTQEMGKLLGFRATILPFAEVPQAFSTGLIDALFTSPQTGVDIQAWDNTKHFMNVGAMFPKNAIIVNKRAFAALPESERQELVKAGDEYARRGWAMSKEAYAKGAATLKAHGMTVTEAPTSVVEAMKKVGVKMAEEWKATASPAAIAVLDAYEKQR